MGKIKTETKSINRQHLNHQRKFTFAVCWCGGNGGDLKIS